MTVRRRTVLLLLCLLLAAAGALYAASQSQTVRRQALRQVEALLAETLGREVRIEAVQLQPWLGAADLLRVRVARGAALADGPLFTAERIRARWSWRALLQRHLMVRRLLLDRPRLTLPAATGAGPGLEGLLTLLLQPQRVEVRGWTLSLGRADVREGRAAWAEADGTPVSLEGLEGMLRWSQTPGQLPQVTGSLHAARLSQGSGEARRRLETIVLELTGTADLLTVSAAEFDLAGAHVSAQGRVLDAGRAPRLDLRLVFRAPLDAALAALSVSRRMEGTLHVNGRLQGPWGEAPFQGEGTLRLGGVAAKAPPISFAVRWMGGVLEAATLAGPRQADSLRGTLTLQPATGAYQAQASVTNADLAASTGMPGALASLFGLHLPPELRGLLSADVDLAGRGGDLATLRGHARLHVDDLGVAGETPAGSLDARLLATSTALQVEAFSLELPGGDIQGRGGWNLGTGRLDLPLRADLRDVGVFARGFGLPSLAGRASFAGRLAGTGDLPRLLGRLTWREARLGAQGFDQIEGAVEVAPRAIRSSRLTLRAGRTQAVLRGSVTAGGSTPLRALDWRRDLSLDLQGQVSPARTADIIALLPEDLEIRGGFRVSGRLTGSPRALDGDLKLQLENVRTWSESWQRGGALLHLQEGAVEIRQISLRRGEEQLGGEIHLSAEGDLGGSLTSTPMDLARAGFLTGGQLGGRGSFRLEFQGTLRDTRTLGQAAVGSLSYRGIPLGPGAATFTVERKAADVDLTLREGAYRLHLALSPPPDRRLQATLALRDANLDLVLQVADVSALDPWQTRASGTIQAHGPAEDLAASQGEADFTWLRLERAGEVWESRGPVQIGWNQRTLSLGTLRLVSGDHEVEIRGTAGEGDQTDISVQGSLPLAALPGLPPAVHHVEGLGVADLKLRGSWDAPELLGKLEIRQGRLAFSGLRPEFSEVQATLDLARNRVEAREWRARLADGDFRGGLELLRQDGRWKLRTTFQVDGGRAEQLLAGLYGGKGEVTGTLSLGGVLSGGGGGSADFWRNLEGDLKLTMQNGRIGRYTSLAKLLSILNVVQMLELKSPELSAEGMPYQSLTADIRIQRGVARTDNLVLDSRSMKVNAVGTVNLAEDTANLTVAIKPFQTVDSVVSHIPLAGWLLAGKEKSLVVAYYQVTGSVRDPVVTPIPMRSVGRNVFGIFKNLLELPEVITGPYEELPPQLPRSDEGQGR